MGKEHFFKKMVKFTKVIGNMTQQTDILLCKLINPILLKEHLMLPKYMVRALRERMERKENVFIIWETLSNGLTMNGLKIKSFKNGVR